MISYDKLLGEPADWKTIEQVCKQNRFDYKSKWIALTYYIGLKKGLKDYQARSFASEMTLLLTEQIFNTETELTYKEYELDSYFQNVSKEVSQVCRGKTDDFYLQLRDRLLDFYKSSHSLDFERVNYRITLKLTDKELSLLNSLGCKSYRFAVRKLLLHYDYGIEEDLIPLRDEEKRVTTAYLSLSEYELLRKVPHKEVTNKFLQIFYYYFQQQV